MAIPTCTRCNNNQFELKVVTPIGSEYKVNFIQCNKCGVVIGVLEFYEIGALILQLAERLNVPLDR
mgnify:CR=1 FL=1